MKLWQYSSRGKDHNLSNIFQPTFYNMSELYLVFTYSKEPNRMSVGLLKFSGIIVYFSSQSVGQTLRQAISNEHIWFM